VSEQYAGLFEDVSGFCPNHAGAKLPHDFVVTPLQHLE